MSLTFNEAYFTTNSEGMANYSDNFWFELRAQWLYEQYIAFGFNAKIYEIGCAFGYVQKYLLEPSRFGSGSLIPQGLEISQYAYDQAIANDLPSENITLLDACNWAIPNDIEFIVSWNFFDSLSSVVDVQTIITELNDKSNDIAVQIHVICTLEDPDSSHYTEQGYLMRSLTDWQIDFGTLGNATPSNNNRFIVEYHTGNVWRLQPTGWQLQTDLFMPLTHSKVSD